MEKMDVCISERESLSTTIPATFVSFKRGRRTIHEKYTILKMESVTSREAAEKYIGNCVLSIRTSKNGEKRNVYGVVTRVHGRKGAVMCKFSRNMDPKSIGSLVYVKLYKVERDDL